MTRIQEMVWMNSARVRAELIRQLQDDDNWNYLCRYSVERAESEGVEVYGDAAWGKAEAELQIECDQELADAIFYLSVKKDVYGNA